MYKLVIIDDEYVVRRGLKDFINWDELGFSVIATCEDGKEALDFIKANHVDAILVDIDMPVMTGLELLEKLMQFKIKCKSVILTGYKDFEYAQKAIEYKADRYILKPIENNLLRETFSSLKEELDKEELVKSKNRENIDQVESMTSLIKTQLLEEIVNGSAALNNITDILQSVDLGFDQKSNPIVIVEISIENYETLIESDWHYGKDALNQLVINFFKGNRQEYSAIEYIKEDNCIIFGFILPKDSNVHTEGVYINQYLSKTKESVLELTKIQISIDKIVSFSSIEEALLANQNAKIIVEDIEESYQMELDNSHEELSYLFNAINSTFVEKGLDEVFQKIDVLSQKLQDTPFDTIKTVYSKLLYILSTNFTHSAEQNFEFFQADFTGTTPYDLLVYTKTATKILKQQMLCNGTQHIDTLITESLEYIDQNYYKDISREEVSKHVFLNSSYFSRCFKQKTGMKFIDYLTKVRIEAACELLKDRKNKVSDVSDMVGYNSSAYFTRVFKCYMGVTPNEYIFSAIK